MFKKENTIEKIDPILHGFMQQESQRQESHIELIASENFTSPAVMEAQGSILTNKYAEGYPGARYYGGCQHVDEIEKLAIDRLKKLFGAPFANVQPHSGSQANQAVYQAVLKPGDVILGMAIDQGGHLTHGARVSSSGKIYTAYGYGLNEQEDIDYGQVQQMAHEHKPKLIICGASSFSRQIDFAKFRQIADEVGAYLLADVAHYAGLVVAGLYDNPMPHAHFVTSTTHKTLRGPRGGIVLMATEELAKKLNSAVFPQMQGGPLLAPIAGKAIAFQEAMQVEFRDYQKQVLANAQAMAGAFVDKGWRVISGGTDCHMFCLDVTSLPVGDGKKAQDLLDSVHITLNKNGLPRDTLPPTRPGGIRIGTPACTTRGFGVSESLAVADIIADALNNPDDQSKHEELRARVKALVSRFPIYS